MNKPTPEIDKKHAWFAIYTKPRNEKSVANALNEKGIEAYCPVQKVQRQWSDRKKIILEPVFKTYVFVSVCKESKWEVLDTAGVLNFVHWNGKPAVIRDIEIIALKKFLNDYEEVIVQDYKLEIGQSVQIKQGVFCEHTGIIQQVNGNKVWLHIKSIGILLQAVVPAAHLEPIKTA